MDNEALRNGLKELAGVWARVSFIPQEITPHVTEYTATIS